MGIFGALTTAVGGLRANSFALENISGNIANSQTTAFKRIDTSFMDIIPDTGLRKQVAGGVIADSRRHQHREGDIQNPSVATYMAINGDGFFVGAEARQLHRRRAGVRRRRPLHPSRRFPLDKNGYLVNGAGYYLEGVPIDPTTGNPIGSSPQVLKFQNDFLPAQAPPR